MQSIINLFVGISVFFSGLFGATNSAPVSFPGSVVESVSTSSRVIDNKNISEPVSSIGATSSTSIDQLSTSSFLYMNEKYGFSLSLPESWKGYSVKEDDKYGSHDVSFGVNTNTNLFIVSIFTRKEWEQANKNVDEGGDPSLPDILAQNSRYVFVSFRPHDYSEFPPLSDRGSILSTLALTGDTIDEKAWIPFGDFAKDYRGNVYFSNGTLVKDADQESFTYIGNGFAKDKNAVYYQTLSGLRTFLKLDMADPKSFIIKNNQIPIDSKNVYTWHKDHFDILAEADPATITRLGVCSSFGSGLDVSDESSNVFYFKDDQRVFPDLGYSSIDLSSFSSNYKLYSVENGVIGDSKNIGGVVYAQDKNGIYVGCGAKINGVDKNTFQVLDFGYSKDRNYVYYLDKVVEGVDPETFKPTAPKRGI